MYYSLNVNLTTPYEMRHYLSNEDKLVDAHRFPPHLHDEMEFYVLLEGDVSFMVERSLYHLTAGDVIVTKPNEMHNCILNSDSVHKHMCFWFSAAQPSFFANMLERPFGKENLISLPTPQKQEFLSVCLDLHQAAIDQDDLKQFYLSLQFIHLLRSYKTAQQDDVAYIPQLLKDILEDINVHFSSIETLDYFTEKYFISQSTLQRLFKKYLHVTPKIYLETKRLAYSRVLLKQGISVLDACMQAGFPDYSNYIRLFKNRFGITPKRYQENK